MTGHKTDALPPSGGWLRETRRTLALALPMVGAYVAELGMWWTDQAIVGRLGADELAAVGLSGSVMFEGINVSMALLSMVAVLVGNAYGARRPEGVTSAVRQGLRVATVLTVAVMAWTWFVPDMLELAGQEPLMVGLAREYVHAFMFGLAPMLYFTVMRAFVAGVSRPLVVTLITVATIPLNLGVNVVLVFGTEVALGPLMFAIPAMGVAGAAWGSTLVTWLMLLALIADVLLSPAARPYRVLSDVLRHERHEWRTIWRLGLPVGLLALAEGGLLMAVTQLAGLIGVAMLAANQVAANLGGLGTMIAMGIGEAAAVRVAQELGAGRPAGARKAGHVAFLLGLAVALVLAVPLVVTPEALAGIFLDVDDAENAAALALIPTLCTIAAVFLAFDCTQIIAARVLRGLHDTAVPAWISIAGYWVLAVPLGALLAFPLGLDGPGLWWGMAAGLAVAATWLALRFEVLASRLTLQRR